MNLNQRKSTVVGLALVASLMAVSAASRAADAIDADAAKATLRQNNCFKCHGVEKKKDGPSYQSVAAKYKGRADAEAKLIHHLTSGEKAKFPDGHEEDHKIIKTENDAELKNLVHWILSL